MTNPTLELQDLYQIAPDDIQAQYRDTNVHQLIQGIADIKKKYLGKGLESLRNDNLNITTAKEDGLDMWGNLINFYRYIPSESNEGDINYFNFNDKNFNRLQFENPNNPSYGRLADYVFRRFLVLIYQAMYQVNTIPNMNVFINEFFPDFEKIEVRDTFDMSFQVYVFFNDGAFPAWLKWVLSQYDILPRPAGVGSSYIDRAPLRRFGFAPEGTTDPYYFKNIGAFNRSNFADLEE